MENNREEAVRLTRERVVIHEMINFDRIPENPIKVSIVVPVCNVEEYLRECLDSCINQTLRDIEIICVNDGSTDSSLDILREYAEKDERVKVVDKDNAGYGHTMNLGMDLAQGEYIGIVESDDFVELNMYEELYNIAFSENLDIIKSDFCRFTHDNKGNILKDLNRVAARVSELYNTVTSAAEDQRVFHLVMQTWSGIYRKEFLDGHNIRHNETPGASYQDNGFWFQTFMYAKRVYFYNKPFYMNRRDNPNSSVHNKGKVYCMNEEYRFIKELMLKDPDLYERYKFEYSRKKFANYLFTYRRIGDEFKQEYLNSLQAELLEAIENDELCWDIIDSKEQQELHMILDSPQDFYELEQWKNTSYEADEWQEHTVKVSVIIPVYNGEEFIDECLKSVIGQTLSDIEIICIDDGSEDNTLGILNSYQQRDSRIIILTQEHMGGGAARNKGLDIAQGEYLSFLDGDDFFESDMLESIYNQCKSNYADIGIYKVKRYDNITKKIKSDSGSFVSANIPKKKVFSSWEIKDKIFGTFQTWTWNKLFRRKYIEDNHLRFQEIMRTNDMFFVYTALLKAKRITTLPRELVFYRVGTTANCQSTNSLFPKDFFYALLELGNSIKNIGNKLISINYRKSFENLVCKSCIYNLNSLKEAGAYAELYNFLHSDGFSENMIDISTFEEDNIEPSNRYNYRECMHILDFSFEEYTFDKISFYRVNSEVTKKKISELETKLKNKSTELDNVKKLYGVDRKLNSLESEVNKLKFSMGERQAYQTELLLIRSSFSYKLGRLITWLPRKIRGLFKK